MSSLTVYKASAGSGKTFTLAVEYIKYLVADPASFRNILAVTFTNKATDEMKTRIMSQLYGITRRLPDSADYLRKVAEETGIAPEDAERAAGIALSLLIHNYDYFHVETIDSFFQSVLRNLARELDLSANLRIELNDTAVESKAVDVMIEELDAKSPLFAWLVRFVMDKIDDNKSWNIIRSVKDFGKMIFDDNYRQSSKLITEKLKGEGFIASFRKRLGEEKSAARRELASIQTEFNTIIQENGIEPTDFKGGQRTGIQKYFQRLSDDDLRDKNFMLATVAKCLDSEENWAAKTNRKCALIRSIAASRLMPLLEAAEQKRQRALYVNTSVDATLKNINNLRLLNDIEKTVKEMNAEANRFLLSDTQHLLRMMMGDADSPFIFEKIGTSLGHIMIDEFQDTSTVQWSNFKILLSECMSHAADAGKASAANLIVGDIKQSIYRWRSGDWRILNGIRSSFPAYPVNIMTLQTNYRSEKNIVDFNNAFFKKAVDVEYSNERGVDPERAKLIKSAYGDVEQQTLKTEKNGLVDVKLLEADNYEERTLQLIAEYVMEMRGMGVPMSSIAILLRSNKNIPLIANYFTDNYPELNIVSDEAFRLDHSVAINCIVNALRYLYDEKDMLTKACLAKSYSLARSGVQIDSDRFLDISNDESDLLPEAFTTQMKELKDLPLYDLCEKLLSVFGLSDLPQEGAYICAFFDILSAYISDMSADVSGFLAEWDDNLHSKTIQTDGVDGIRIISIHKSKGLEFDNVILPFCDWKLEIYSQQLWCRPKEAPYNELPLLPVTYSPALARSVYADDYKLEHMQNTIDNLNMLYVAFTRPKRNMFVIGKRKSSQTRSWLIEESLEHVADKLEGAVIEGLDSPDGDLHFLYGSFCRGKANNGKPTDNVFLKPDASVDTLIASEKTPVNFRQSNNSKDFIMENADETDDTAEKRSGYIKTGNILHLIFSNIRTADDIPSVLQRYEMDGVLYGDELSREKLEALLAKCLSENKLVADWFSTRWTLFNECTILCEDVDKETGKKEFLMRRPDRVMKDGDEVVVVDFKFGKMNDKYTRQVASYIGYLRDMGYKNVRGYLWFVLKNEVREVKA